MVAQPVEFTDYYVQHLSLCPHSPLHDGKADLQVSFSLFPLHSQLSLSYQKTQSRKVKEKEKMVSKSSRLIVPVPKPSSNPGSSKKKGCKEGRKGEREWETCKSPPKIPVTRKLDPFSVPVPSAPF